MFVRKVKARSKRSLPVRKCVYCQKEFSPKRRDNIYCRNQCGSNMKYRIIQEKCLKKVYRDQVKKQKEDDAKNKDHELGLRFVTVYINSSDKAMRQIWKNGNPVPFKNPLYCLNCGNIGKSTYCSKECRLKVLELRRIIKGRVHLQKYSNNSLYKTSRLKAISV